MLYPSLSELTNKNINRYALVIATAKCARHINQKLIEERETSEKHSELDRFSKDYKAETAESVNEKAVSVAIRRIHDGTYRIIIE